MVPQDTFDVARDVFRHRLMLSYEALAKGLSVDSVLHRVLAMVPAAAISPVEIERNAGAASTTPLSTPFLTPGGSSSAPSPPAAPSLTSPTPGDLNDRPPPPAPTHTSATSGTGASPGSGSELSSGSEPASPGDTR